MKTRTGFVSNSSSSSFVILGFSVPKNDYDCEVLEDIVEKLGGEIIYVEESYSRFVDSLLIGVPIAEDADSGGGELSDRVFDLATATKQLEKIMEELGIIVPPKIFSGSTGC